MSATANDAVSQVEEFVALSQSGANPRRINSAYERLERTLHEATAEEGGRARLMEVAATHASNEVRESLFFALNPVPPSAPGDALDAWLAHPAVGAEELAPRFEARSAPVIVENSEAPPSYRTWLAGLPLAGPEPWPRNVQGEALAHVVQIDLNPEHWGEDLEAWASTQGLPTGGVLQVFHDLWSEEPDALVVRYVATPEVHALQPPEDYDLLRLDACLANHEFGLTVPSALDVDDLDPAEVDLWEDLRQRLFTWQTWAIRDGYPAPARPVLTLLGHGWFEKALSLARLAEQRPETATEDWRLLLDIPGVRHLDGWFGDEGHLEVWIEDADLRAARFERALPVLRTS